MTHQPITTATKADNLKGDNYLQRQVEPTIAASTFNADHLLAAFGDYRQVDFPNDTGLPGAAAQGWIGYSRSYDRGKHWYGAMVPGFPGGTSTADLSSPLHGLAAGSDAVLATTPGGHFYLGALFFSPGGVSNIAVMHLRDVPSLDGGDAIKPGKITIVDRGSASDTGNFEDKPAIGADIARGTTDPAVCGPVYAAYTIFVGGGDTVPFVSKIGFSRSKQGKCGEAWDNDQYINKNYKQNQGTAIAADPKSGKIYVVWRHVFVPGGDGFPDSILMASSTDFGSTFSAPAPITGADFAPYDQISIDSTTDPNHMAFRSSAFPAIAVDGFGNVYVAVQERVAFGPPAPARYNEPRIVMRALRAGATSWSKGFVEANPIAGGQQVMPSLAVSAGVLRAMWYDFRRPESFVNDPVNGPAWGLPSTCDNAGHCYVTGLDRRMETRIAQLATNSVAGMAFAPSVPVTKYETKVSIGGKPAVNRPNLPLYVGGTTAFTGDYITVAAGSPFVANDPGTNPPFRWATQPTDVSALPSLTAWTDSRDVVFPLGAGGRPELSVANIQSWQAYAPPGTGLASCTNPGSRNQNVYFSEVKTGVIAGSPATSRQLVDGSGRPFERAFPFYVQNTTLANKAFRLTFDSTAVKGSFVQGAAQTAVQSPAPFIDVTIGPISTASKTIYAYCPTCTAAAAFARFNIKVDEIDHVGGAIVSPGNGGLTTQLRFNADPTAPFVTNEQLANQEIHNVSFSTGSWARADWSSADWSSADWSSADWSSADWSSADWSSADWSSADWSSADWSSADWSSMGPVGDLVAKASNTGNNASSYSVSVNIDPALAANLHARGYLAGLFITRSYNKPNSFAGCAIQPIPFEHIISVIPLDLTSLGTTVLDTAAFAAVPSTNAPLAAGSSSGAAAIQPDDVFIVLRLFAPRTGGAPPPPLPVADQAALIANVTTTVTPQAANTVAGKQTATVTLTNLRQVYTGSPLMPTATTNPPGLAVVFSGAPQTNVGTYPVLATINDPVYQGSATGTFVITPAPSTTTVTCPASVTYNGSAQTPCTATVTGAGGLNAPLSVSYSNNINAGTATAAASYVGDGNHFGSTGSKTFTISRAASVTTFGPAPAASFPGGNFTVSASNTSGGTITYSTVSGSCSVVDASAGTFSPTSAGSCVVRADSAATLNFLASSAQQTVTIGSAVLLFAGNDTQGPVRLFDRNGTARGTFGAAGATGSALDGVGHVYTAVPNFDSTSSVITKYDAAQNVVSTMTVNVGVEDMAYGGNDTLWLATNVGTVYHVDASGATLSQFDTGSGTIIGVATDGTVLYTTAGFGRPNNVEKRALDGTLLATYDTGLTTPGLMGIGFDASDGTLWVGSLGRLDHVTTTGTVLGSFATSGSYHDGLEVGAIFQSILWTGNDTEGPVQEFTPGGMMMGTFGAAGATGSALDGVGHVYTVVPACDASVITKYDAAQTVLGTIRFDTGIENGQGCRSWIEDMTYGGNDTLWLSGFNGVVYHIDAAGTILSHFDTGFTFTGIATDGAFLYTTEGFSGEGIIHRWNLDGTNPQALFDTGVTGGLVGLAFDASDGTLWAGSEPGLLFHYSMAGAPLGSIQTGSQHVHDGLEVGPIFRAK